MLRPRQAAPLFISYFQEGRLGSTWGLGGMRARSMEELRSAGQGPHLREGL